MLTYLNCVLEICRKNFNIETLNSVFIGTVAKAESPKASLSFQSILL